MCSRMDCQLYDMACLDANKLSDDGRFDKVSDINELWAQYSTAKLNRIEFLRRYADIFERD